LITAPDRLKAEPQTKIMKAGLQTKFTGRSKMIIDCDALDAYNPRIQMYKQ
jgi:hypothetical protein